MEWQRVAERIEALARSWQGAAAIPYFQRGLHMGEDGSIWALSEQGIRDLPDDVLAVICYQLDSADDSRSD